MKSFFLALLTTIFFLSLGQVANATTISTYGVGGSGSFNLLSGDNDTPNSGDRDNNITPYSFNFLGVSSYSQASGISGYGDSMSSNINNGYLSTHAAGDGDDTAIISGSANLWDTLYFSGNFQNKSATLLMNVSDVLDINHGPNGTVGPGSGSGSACIAVYSALCSGQYVSTTSFSNPYNYEITQSGILSVTFPLSSSVLFSGIVLSSATYGASSTIDPGFSLILPNGVSVTSASGNFYQTNLASTPEPSTWLLMGTGLMGLAWIRHWPIRKRNYSGI